MLKPFNPEDSVYLEPQTIITLAVLCLMLTAYFAHMRYVLAKYFSESFVREKRRINCLFGLILACFIMRTISSLVMYFMRT